MIIRWPDGQFCSLNGSTSQYVQTPFRTVGTCFSLHHGTCPYWIGFDLMITLVI